MKKIKVILIVTVLHSWAVNLLHAQGCSDAGFCTISSFKPNSTDSTKGLNNQFKVGAFYGKADNAISVYGNYVEYNRQLSSKFGLDAKLTTLAQYGNGIKTFGLSDLFVNANYKASKNVQLTLGTKIPLSNSGKTYNQLALPMDYQASLGTFDVLFGIGYTIKKVQLLAAIQQPITQNGNQFIATNYPTSSKLRLFQSTNQFQRSGDILFRVSYPIALHNKLKLTPSILPIYHLKKDKYTDELNVKREINNSQGLTLNGTMYLDYTINSKSTIQINFGVPFIVRAARPDGLTRSVIANVEYSLKF